MKLLKYLNDNERYHEFGHVWGFGLLSVLFSIPSLWWKPWFYFVPFIVLSVVLFLELIVERWLEEWGERIEYRGDFFYDVLSKGVYGPLFGYLIASNFTNIWDYILLLVVGGLLPYKFEVFR